MKKLLALLLAVAMLLSFAACGEEKPVTTDDESTTLADDAAQADGTEIASEAESAQAVTEESEAASSEAATEATASTEAASEEATEAETTQEALAAPETTEEIIAFYNDSINAAYNAKVGFNKSRVTDNDKMDAGIALMAFKSLVYKFMGVGEENKYSETVTKGNWDSDTRRYYLRKSTLSAADVTKAACTEKNGQYTIVLNVKGGSSKGAEGNCFTKAPIDKCGICVGNEDKGYYDHKTGEVIYDAIDDTYAGAVIEENYKNATVNAVIDAQTGHLVKLTVEFDINVAIDISIGSGTASASTHIYYTNFKY